MVCVCRLATDYIIQVYACLCVCVVCVYSCVFLFCMHVYGVCIVYE